ncbi:hypothetical protein BX600DRAFT_548910 [Xylariales sp. PMI_506]|nr:hypothetical protein BX600DRAFT_548910 [Xylariales sp. PMI_506]
MLSLAAAAVALLPAFAVATTYTATDNLTVGAVKPEAISVTGGLDGPKLSPIAANETSYDWWYFDAVSASSDASVVFVFYNSGPDGFVNDYLGGPFSVSLSGAFANGTLFSTAAAATGGIVVQNSQAGGIQGNWEGSGFSFVGSSLTSSTPTYTITVDSPEAGVYGTVTFKARAPAHYPCGANKAGQTEQLMPNVFWSNAVPDAHVTVDLLIGGTRVVFSDGVGYHDKNWGDAPFVTATSSWYWGHAYVEPYSIVWFDAIDAVGTEHFSGYVAKNGAVIASSCAADAVVVRPWGANSDYPPKPTSGIMQGVEATFDLGAEGTLVANVTTALVLVDAEPFYVRTIGTVVAGLVGGSTCKGKAVFEEFKIAP